MNLEDYLGNHEGQSLEFKGRDAIDNRLTIPRAVCAMANAEGGEIIVGIAEGGPGHHVETIDDFTTAREKIVNRLSDRIEPTPKVRVEKLPSRGGGCGIRIAVETPRTPQQIHACLIDGGYVAWTRVDHRVRKMSWEEVLRRMGAVEDRTVRPIEEDVEAWIERVTSKNRSSESQGTLIFVARLLSPGGPELDLAGKERLRRYIQHPEELGLDRSGFDYATKNPAREISDGEEIYSSGDPEQGYRYLEVTPGGIVRFSTRLDLDLVYRGQSRREGNRPFLVLLPLPFLSTLRSLTRLHAAVARELARPKDAQESLKAEACCKLIGVQDVRLGRAGFGEPGTDPNGRVHDEIFPSGSTLPMTAEARIDEYVPAEGTDGLGDRLARRLAGKAYNAFLVTDEEVPYYDDRRQRFIFD